MLNVFLPSLRCTDNICSHIFSILSPDFSHVDHIFSTNPTINDHKTPKTPGKRRHLTQSLQVAGDVTTERYRTQRINPGSFSGNKMLKKRGSYYKLLSDIIGCSALS